MSSNTRFAALGDYRFTIDKNTYNSLQRAINYRWQKTNIINHRPNYQTAGINEELITINGAVFNYRANQGNFDSPLTETGIDQITQLRNEAEKNTPLRFALDDGQTLGYWVIKSISEQQTNLIQAAAMKQSYNIQLAFFGNTL